MLAAYQFQVLRKEEDVNEEIRPAVQWPAYSLQVDGYKREHPQYQEELVSYEEWLKTEDRQFDDEMECGI